MIGHPDADRPRTGITEPRGQSGTAGHHHGERSRPVLPGEGERSVIDLTESLGLRNVGNEDGDRLHRRTVLEAEQRSHRRLPERVHPDAVHRVGREADDQPGRQGLDHPVVIRHSRKHPCEPRASGPGR